MSEIITGELFSDGQQNINAANMNGIIGRAVVQPDIIAAKPASATMDVADMMLVLKTDNTLAKSRFDTIVNSTSSVLPLADTARNGTLRQVSGLATDFVDGTNHCQPLANVIPPGTVFDYAGSTIPSGWLPCDGASKLRTDFPALFTAIGTTYGSVDGTHFTLPDARGRTAIGVGTGAGLTARALGAKLGEEKHILTVQELATHSHVQNAHSHGILGTQVVLVTAGGAAIAQVFGTSTTDPATAVNQNNGSNTPHENMPPFIAFNKMIKT